MKTMTVAAARLQLVLLLLAGVALVAFAQADPPYDHQTTTYVPSHKPVTLSHSATMAAFFSPDHSADTLTYMINNATSTIDIATPGFSSWSSCSGWEATCVGCAASDMRQEPFPIFPALLNAIHQRGVRVRLLTNNYNTPTCDGMVAPLDFLAMNGVEVRFYTSTTFMHAKYMQVDGKRASVSSINYSQTSFMKNREAGVVIYEDAPEFLAFLTEVFEADMAQGAVYEVTQQYNSSVMSVVMDKTPLPVNIPTPRNIDNAYVSPAPRPITTSNVQLSVFTGPDFARDTLMAQLQTAQKSFAIMMYQINDQGLCTELINMHKSGIALTLLVSARIYDINDWKTTQVCYNQLYSAGIRIRKTPSYYTYSHQKFWIIDGARMGMSTGNWSPSDYSAAAQQPPFGQSGWAPTNRDFNVLSDAYALVNVFSEVLTQDYQRGTDWYPSKNGTRGGSEIELAVADWRMV